MQRSKPSDGELKFELLAEIAVGETARVELCRVTEGARAGELVAVKRLHPHIAEDPQFVDMFRDEVWMTAALKHKNVVEVVGWGQDAEGPWLAVEFVRGVSLQRLMKTVFETGERFTERMVVFLARSICDGLGTAHSLRSADGDHLNLVHRDLTPGNVLLGFDGQVKITDFGLAKAKQRLTRTLTGMLKGQPQYMSPEQVQGKALDARSDIFAVGVLLFELFSGRRPWKAQSDLDAMRAITDEAPADLQALRPRIDRALVDIVERCLQKDPADRFQTAFELCERFDQWLIAHGYRDDNHSSLARFVRRNAMRQMRWFERAVAGEFAEKARAERAAAPAQPAPLAPRARPTRRERTVRSDPPSAGTQQTSMQTPESRAKEVHRAPLDSTTATPERGERPVEEPSEPSSIDWGDDGPTLIKRSTEARAQIDRALAQPPRGNLPSAEPSTQKRRLRRPPPSSRPPQSPARRTVGNRGPEGAPAVGEDDVAKQIVSAASAAHAERQRTASADDTVQMSESGHAAEAPPRRRGRLGVVAPPDPDVPPLPPERAAEHTMPMVEARRASPDETITRAHLGHGHADATLTRAQLPRPGADGTITQARAAPEPAYRPPPGQSFHEPEAFAEARSYHERSSDFAEEARRLGGEARVAAEQAQLAALRAEAAARAAALAGEAALLAAVGERHDAIQKLREAQIVDEAIKRGEIPARAPLVLDAELMATGYQPAPRRLGLADWIATREGATITVIATVSLLAALLLIVWLV